MREVTRITVTPERDVVVDFTGDPVRSIDFYEVNWTESEDGHVDADFSVGVADSQRVGQIVNELLTSLKPV